MAFDGELYALAMAGEPRAAGEAVAAKSRDRPWFAKLYPEGFKTSDDGWAWLSDICLDAAMAETALPLPVDTDPNRE